MSIKRFITYRRFIFTFGEKLYYQRGNCQDLEIDERKEKLFSEDLSFLGRCCPSSSAGSGDEKIHVSVETPLDEVGFATVTARLASDKDHDAS